MTHITRIQGLTTMCALMSYQVTLLTKCLMTQITGIWMLSTMYALMSYQATLMSE